MIESLAIVLGWLGIGFICIACNGTRAYSDRADVFLDILLWPIYLPVLFIGWSALRLAGKRERKS